MILTAQTLVGWFVRKRKYRTGMKRRMDGEAYVRPTVKIPVKTSFCGWLVLKRQRIGIGWFHWPFISLPAPMRWKHCMFHSPKPKAQSP